MEVLRTSDTRKEEQRKEQHSSKSPRQLTSHLTSVADTAPQSCQSHKDLSLNRSAFYTERGRHSSIPTDTSVSVVCLNRSCQKHGAWFHHVSMRSNLCFHS